MAEAQMSLTTFKEEFTDQLTCAVCLDQYTQPKTLPCHHSFCLKCILPLPHQIKEGKRYIKCPKCCSDHMVPENGQFATTLPSAFQINSLLDLQKKLPNEKSPPKSSITQSQNKTPLKCPIHNDELKVYCNTCSKVICRECPLSDKHKQHDCELVEECYLKHYEQIVGRLHEVKDRLADVDADLIELDAAEANLVKQSEDIKKEMDAHAQHLINQITTSHENLVKQLEEMMKVKMDVVVEERKQVQMVQCKLKDCEQSMERNLNEWTHQQILIEKFTMIAEADKAVNSAIDPKMIKPAMKTLSVRFVKDEPSFGKLKKNELKVSHYQVCGKMMEAMLTCDDLSLLPPISLITANFITNSGKTMKCDVAKDEFLKRVYHITVIPSSSGQLSVQVKDEDVAGSPVPIAVVPSTVKPSMVINRLIKPRKIAIRASGGIFAVIESSKITIFNENGKKLTSFGSKGTEQGEFMNAEGLAFTSDGHILVTDEHRLQKLKTNGKCLRSIGNNRAGDGQNQFNYPAGIAVDYTTKLAFIADGWNCRIYVCHEEDLSFSHCIKPKQDVKLTCPNDLALDGKGCLYVSEYLKNRITKFTTAGQYITHFGGVNSLKVQINHPMSLAIYENFLYVSEFMGNCVTVLSTSGELIHSFGKKGKTTFNKPVGIAVDRLGGIYVCDSENCRIVIYRE